MALAFIYKWFQLGRQLLDGQKLNEALAADTVSVQALAVATGSTVSDATPITAAAINISPFSVNNGGLVLTGYQVGARVSFVNYTGVTVRIYAKNGTVNQGAWYNLNSLNSIILLQFDKNAWLPVAGLAF